MLIAFAEAPIGDFCVNIVIKPEFNRRRSPYCEQILHKNFGEADPFCAKDNVGLKKS